VAIDTANKRASTYQHILVQPLPFPDGSVDTGDKQHVMGLYRTTLTVLVGKSLQMLWDLGGLANRSLNMLWDMGGVTGRSLTVVYDMGGVAGRSLQMVWDIGVGAAKKFKRLYFWWLGPHQGT